MTDYTINDSEKILSVDTSRHDLIQVSLAIGHKTIIVTDKQALGSQVLLPLIISTAKKAKIELTDLTGIKLNTGPGSFTGIRVGASIANALGYALSIPVNNKIFETDLKY